MKKKYYITSFVHGVVFTSMKQLRAYYIRSTKSINGKRKPEEVNCGEVKSFKDSELNDYLAKLKPVCIWRICTK